MKNTIIELIESRDELATQMTKSVVTSIAPVLAGVMQFMKRTPDAMVWEEVRLTETGIMVWGTWDARQPEYQHSATRTFVCGIPSELLESNDADVTCEYFEQTHLDVAAEVKRLLAHDPEIESIEDLERSLDAVSVMRKDGCEAANDSDISTPNPDLCSKRVLH